MKDSLAAPVGETDTLICEVVECLVDTLQLPDKRQKFTAETRLLGDIPELDSMAVVTVITGLEERFGFVVDDDEISAETFETVGTLAEFVREKVS